MSIKDIAKLLFVATRLRSDFFGILDGFLSCKDSTMARRSLNDRSRFHLRQLVQCVGDGFGSQDSVLCASPFMLLNRLSEVVSVMPWR